MGTRQLFLSGGLCSLALGIAGAFLPLLPTTPFILLAAYCFSRSSPAWHDWMCRSPWFGPILQEWETHHGVRRSVKWLATILLGLSVCGTFWSYGLGANGWSNGITTVVLLLSSSGLIVVWQLPEVTRRRERVTSHNVQAVSVPPGE